MKRLWQKIKCKLGLHDTYLHKYCGTRQGVRLEWSRYECRACQWAERDE